MEIWAYPKKCRPFALLYLTGSVDFNRGMRQEAERMGFTLSDTGLRVTASEEEIRCDSEEDVFKRLGMEYKKPEQRNV